MKTLYLKGTSTTQREMNIVKALFCNQGLEITPIYYSYSKLTLLKKEKLEKALSNAITYLHPDEKEFNLICQGTGCNLGIILANSDERINKLTLVSPSIVPSSETEEKNQIKVAFKNKYFGEILDRNNELATLEELKSLILYARTSKIAKKILNDLENELLILYSCCDLLVSPNYMNELSKKDNVESYSINSCNHNPIITKPKETIPKIKQFIR